MAKYNISLFLCLLVFSYVVLAQNVYIPDENFKNGLINLGVDTNNDGEISFEEASGFSGQLLLDSLGIEDITGIEAFTFLKYLSVNYNHLDSLNYDINPQLEDLYCKGNNLIFLDITYFPNLVNIDCSLNDLSNLILLNLANLISLNCSKNLLTNLDPSGCSSLKYLRCNDNQLDSLDLSSCSVTYLYCNNNNLKSIIFSLPIGFQTIHCANNQLDELNILGSAVKYLNCGFNNIKKLHLSHHHFLQYLYCNNNNLDTLYLWQNKWSYLKKIDCSFNNLKNSTTNFVYSFDLNTVDCSHNQFDSVYFYNETFTIFDSLKVLNCSNNKICDTISINNYPLLKKFDCSNNYINHIGFGSCKILDTLVCGNNLIAELDITNLLQLKFLDISYSYNLIDICTRKLPYDFDINAIGPCYYNLSVCSPAADPHIFLAGQFAGCYNIELNYEYPFDKSFFDCNNDGIDDIELYKIFIPGYYSFSIIPLSGNYLSSRLNSQGDPLIKGFWEDEMVYPVDYSVYDEGLTFVYGDIEYYGQPTWTTHWILNRDLIFSTILPSDNDTTYAWLRIKWNPGSHIWFIDDYHIHEIATWKPCFLSHSIGSDTTINVGDTLNVTAGQGHDRYYWNTKDTTQLYQFISNKWGGGTWEIISYIENDYCYSSDTLYVTVIGESIISDYEFNQLDVYPNPVRNKLTVTNPSNQDFTFEIYNLNAKRVYHRKLYGTSDNIDVSGLVPGIYICKIVGGIKNKTIKIIKY